MPLLLVAGTRRAPPRVNVQDKHLHSLYRTSRPAFPSGSHHHLDCLTHHCLGHYLSRRNVTHCRRAHHTRSRSLALALALSLSLSLYRSSSRGISLSHPRSLTQPPYAPKPDTGPTFRFSGNHHGRPPGAPASMRTRARQMTTKACRRDGERRGGGQVRREVGGGRRGEGGKGEEGA